LIVGGGAMGRSLYDGWTKSGGFDGRLAVVDQQASLSIGDAAFLNESERRPVLFVFAVKPQHVAPAISEHETLFRDGDIVVSVAAGVSLSTLREYLGQERSLLRVMPNLAVSSLKGVVGICAAEAVNVSYRTLATDAFSKLGFCARLSEDQFDAFTALAGSGPGFIFRLVEVLAQSGQNIGLERETATEIAKQVVIGAGSILSKTDSDPAALRAEVASPGGTTEAGLKALNNNNSLQRLINQTLVAAKLRSKEISKQYEHPADQS